MPCVGVEYTYEGAIESTRFFKALKAKEAAPTFMATPPAHSPAPAPIPCDWGPSLPTSCSQRTRGLLGKDNVITTLPLPEDALVD